LITQRRARPRRWNFRGAQQMPVELSLFLIGLVVLQLGALLAFHLWLLGRVRKESLETRLLLQRLREELLAELGRSGQAARASRSETAMYLQSIFAGVGGLARNIDASRSVEQGMSEMLKRLAAQMEPEQKPKVPPSLDDLPRDTLPGMPAHTLHEARPPELEEMARKAGK
jgi:hypothetical protein